MILSLSLSWEIKRKKEQLTEREEGGGGEGGRKETKDDIWSLEDDLTNYMNYKIVL